MSVPDPEGKPLPSAPPTRRPPRPHAVHPAHTPAAPPTRRPSLPPHTACHHAAYSRASQSRKRFIGTSVPTRPQPQSQASHEAKVQLLTLFSASQTTRRHLASWLRTSQASGHLK